jgi:hypothetical protein
MVNMAAAYNGNIPSPAALAFTISGALTIVIAASARSRSFRGPDVQINLVASCSSSSVTPPRPVLHHVAKQIGREHRSSQLAADVITIIIQKEEDRPLFSSQRYLLQ